MELNNKYKLLVKEEKMAKQYNKNGYLINKYKKYPDIIETINYNKKYFKKIINRLHLSDCSESICLDIGCSTGDSSIVLSDYFKKVYGLEPDRKLLDVAIKKADYFNKDNIEFIHGFNEYLPFQSNYFDVIISKTVLEHVKNVNISVKEMIRVCKPGGKIYIEVPNYQWLWEGHYHLPMIPLMPKKMFKIYASLSGRDPNFIDHINYITLKKLSKILERHHITNITYNLLNEMFLYNTNIINNKIIKSFLDFLKSTKLNKIFLNIIKRCQLYPSIVLVIEKRRDDVG